MLISTFFLTFIYVMQKVKAGLCRLFKKQADKLTNKQKDVMFNIELFVGGCLASLAFKFFPKVDINLLKVLLYPRAIESLWQLIKHQIPDLKKYSVDREEYFKKAKWYNFYSYLSAEAITIAICMTFLVYAYGFESYALSPSLMKKFDQLIAITDKEKQMFDALRFVTEE
mmetsp:Transcript_19696/g.30416  ORF Transcript_19696/g.30416 Transcript_19696/m.30416 type:complete len:170 (+) Transcript_19696:621-1130(+)|eukprot:CAMPEP_0170493598 /NCGR_PEP_ID=MMETSP0208-20121228/14152_1 /TAXON_ID=197538 /ORGANISM="Strombidium inclinatum, Strain S3" /LENGTH=169 /DNA_ID=CAMNT_0010769547 /DNA_START=621 /DNA_END=1130 /DNA_ORIENTATION=-